ncbi:adhesion G-protein coupled receptor F1 precursor [Mus musculus]|uniref:Adhesion G-protein coupled receptor F1 n=3 Tax=Mus musculus TaxID=10090 RepID=AGRF1_MOUSE|nr:adhesion G-protein coupled receptor F1 precursor [Mus musculus]Q8VEC3.2 RecName: Full=Adhesion G-protein coupled receptor F1; AltName: Full=G protein-coupled receptor 110; Flags: Precursor [Mus musculus]CAQ12617.1 G protein-coupled receptor 110 [Mus musculus]|eukprot:NP_598537.2 adhesion G-protein coupled receptor F1 precursor [Mus musculus]
MRIGLLWLVPLFTLTEGTDGFLQQKNDGRRTKEIVSMVEERHPVHEYEVLLQVTYRDPEEKRELKRFLKLLKSPSPSLRGPSKIIRVKATTYCRSRKGFLECACEDSYTWFPPSCLDPQNCCLHTTGPVPSCNCSLRGLRQSINFCERAKVWGTFEIDEKFPEDLWNSSSDVYAHYTVGIENQLKEAYRRVHGFESVRVTQFRKGSIVVGYEVTGSTSPPELLFAIEQEAEKAQEALRRQFPVKYGSFRVFGKAPCNSISFGFGSENDEYTVPCSSGFTGSMTVRCQSSGWQITRESCVLSQLEELKKELRMIAGKITEAGVASLVQNLSTILLQSPSTTVGNLGSVVSLLSNISSLSLANSLTVSNLTLMNVINIADHILDSASITNWTILLQDAKDASSQLLKTLESISSLIPSMALPLNFSGKFIDWKGTPVTQIQSTRGYNYQMEMRQNASLPIRGHVFIEPDQFQKSHPKTIISMASLTFGDILPITQRGNAWVNGPVISTLIQNYSISEIFLNFSKIKGNLTQPRCVFWDFSQLQWSNAGCQLVNETLDTVLCRCSHLTSFSMLMSPFVPSSVVPVVKWITYIGLSISIASLILCLIIESLFWKQTKRSQTSYTRNICLVNIAVSLLIADVWFIIAATVDPSVSPSGVCVAAVFFTHFFYLAVFFWMLVLGILLAYRIILVFHHMALTTMMAIGFCLGYGCPLLISIITLAVTQPSNSYKRNDVCWLNWSDKSKPLLAFVVPALTIVAVNLVVVLLVLRKLWRPAVGERLNQDDKATAIRMGKSLLVLTPLLGLTWGFGIGTMANSHNLAWHVLFALLNAFQGFFIFCFGILLDTKLRQLLSNKLTTLSSWKQTSKRNASDTVTQPKCLRTFNILQHRGMYALSHTGDSSSDITLTQFLSTE